MRLKYVYSPTLTIFKSLIIIIGLSGIIFAFFFSIPNRLYASKFDNIPIPNSLAGYRNWPSPPPTIRMEINTKTLLRLSSGSEVSLKINAPEAREVKFSVNQNFNDVPWREVKNKQPWILVVEDNQTIYTIYAVFRYRHPQSGQYMISPIVHDSLHLKAPHKKITRISLGYFDWYDLSLNIETLESQPIRNNEASFINIQKKAEETSHQNAYKTILSIPIQFDYSLGDFLSLNQWLLPDLRESIYNMKLIKIYYPDSQSVFLEESYSLLGNPISNPYRQHQSKPLIYNQIIQKLYREPLIPPNTTYIDREVSTLIIDTRGTGWSPSLLAIIMDNKGNTILTPASYSKNEISPSPYLRYLRDINNTGWEIPKDTLLIKALDVDKKNNRIIILEQYGKIIRNNKEQIETLANGNFYLLTD